MEVNGIAHIVLTASNFERSREFYRKLLPFLGLKPMIDSDQIYYCVGGRTAVGIRAAAPEYAGAVFEQNRIGLHHLCFRARERADIDELHDFLCAIGTTIIRAPREDGWAPGYYSLLFEDPDGIRLELNHVPGKGLLA
jgi:catechol 2,3-dioxygenase-like lactoylglutathione lyase family enzyme